MKARKSKLAKKDPSGARKSELGEELTSKENEINFRYFSKNRFNPGKTISFIRVKSIILSSCNPKTQKLNNPVFTS